MKSETSAPADLVPPDLIPEIEAAAEEEHRHPRELVSDAVTRYLSERRFRRDEAHPKIAEGLESLRQGKGLEGETTMAGLSAKPKRTPAEAAAHIRELRKGRFLPEGETIKDLISYGRA